MITIVSAGSGMFCGKEILLGKRDNSNQFYTVNLDEEEDIYEACKNLLKLLGYNNLEDICIDENVEHVNLSNPVFRGLNVKKIKANKNIKQIAEECFLNELYGLGFSNSIKLEDRNFLKLRTDLLIDVLMNPSLAKHIRPSAINNKSVKRLFYSIDRLTGEFPNLYNIMRNN